eukprot:6029782-Pleurochrysis_carterae.AAC.1
MTQGAFDSSKQCNNTIIISNSAFDMLSESSPAFGAIVARATKYVQVRLGFEEAVCLQAFCVRQSKALSGATDFGWHQDTDSVDSMLTLVINLSTTESRFSVAGFADSIYSGQGSALLFDRIAQNSRFP